MTDAQNSDPARRSRPPGWLVEGLDLVDQRRRALLITVGLLVAVGSVVALAAPTFLPRTPVVGAAVGAGALALALGVLVALDSADLTVRGPRHVRAAGGELVAVLPSRADATAATELAGAIEDARVGGRTLLLGMAAATGDGRRSAAWTSAVGHRLAQDGTSVLVLDLTGEGSDRPGFLEMIQQGSKLTSAVELDPELRLARLGPGRDAQDALRAFVEAGSWIPRDLEVLLVALPMAASRPVVRASLVLDQLLIVAERDRTSRVELIAGLDAVEAVGTQAQVILIDDAFVRHQGPVGGPDDPRVSGEGADRGLAVDQPSVHSMPGPSPDPQVRPPDRDPRTTAETQILGDSHGGAAPEMAEGNQATEILRQAGGDRGLEEDELTRVVREPDADLDAEAAGPDAGDRAPEDDDETRVIHPSEPPRRAAPEPALDPASDPMSDPMPTLSPDPAPEPDPDPELASDPELEAEPERESEPESASEHASSALPEPESASEPASSAQPEPESAPEPERVPERESAPELEPDPTPEPEPARDPAPEPARQPHPEPGPPPESRRASRPPIAPDSTDDTSGLPRFELASYDRDEEQDLLTTTARLSRLVDEVSDRESEPRD